MDSHYKQRDWVDHTASLSPALLGAAAGIFVADLLDSEIRKPVGLVIAAVGVATVAPALVELIARKINGPQSRRGSLRRLQKIREGGYGAPAVEILDPEFDDEELGVG